LSLPLSELPELEEGEFFVHDLVGYEVVLVGGSLVGSVGRVYDAAGQTILGVDGEGGEQLIPFTGQIVREVKPEALRIVVDPPPGLLE
jgi:16S rRNA processing protein RimM